ncbi:MAG: J domain-containing protein [Prochlorothrix sp.]|nr:J domain-containing protein [Prochlorothrix sp.]
MPKSPSGKQPQKTNAKKESKQKKTGRSSDSSKVSSDTLNSFLKAEIGRLSQEKGIEKSILEDFAIFVIKNHKKKAKEVKELTLSELKKSIYQYFSVSNTPDLKKSGAFQMATDGMDDLNFGRKESWQVLYRKFIGILPGEENQEGYGCINGVNIFNYFKPWQVFNLDPKVATSEDIKKSYHDLSKIYHPDNQSTGDAQVFDRLTTMYKSLTAGA